jgi:TPR repeat protein
MFDTYRGGLTTPELRNVTRLVPFERHLSAIRWQFVRGVLVGIVVSFTLAVPAFRYSNIRQRRASLRQGFEQTVQENSTARPVPQQQKSVFETAGPSAPSLVLPKPQASKPSTQFRDKAVEPASPEDRAKSPVSSAVSQPAPLTQTSSTEPEPTKKTLATLAQLWASVEAGNSNAAVALADLYLHGEGVPVNCKQARVLLFVASKENNAEATEKLQDLDETGCPAP